MGGNAHCNHKNHADASATYGIFAPSLERRYDSNEKQRNGDSGKNLQQHTSHLREVLTQFCSRHNASAVTAVTTQRDGRRKIIFPENLRLASPGCNLHTSIQADGDISEKPDQ